MQTVASLYNPDLLSREELIDRFVVRLKIFKRLFKDIQESKMKHPEQHILIIGQRGMGKTTLLLRLSFEIENTPDLNSWLMPLMFNEEQYNISKLFKLWETIAEYLEEQHAAFSGLYQDMDNLYEQYTDKKYYEKAAFELLQNCLNSTGKKLVLFIDNFGDMFNKFDKQETQRLREVLMTCPDIRIIAASATVADQFFKYDEPLYEFFKIERLRGLKAKETQELLLKLGESLAENPVPEILETQAARVEALRRLTGGIIRTIILLFEVFLDHKKGNAFHDLERILDRVTPLYKHRMDGLPKQQQEIIDAIAIHWDAVSTKEIAKKTRLNSKLVSAQLKQIRETGLIDRVPTHTKNHLYRIQERFFNIWYLMRNGRKRDKNRVLWLVRFFEDWCDETTFKNRVRKHINYLKGGEYHTKGAWMMTEALAQNRFLSWAEQDELLRVTHNFLKDKDVALAGELSESDLSLYKKAFKFVNQENYEQALDYLLYIQNKNVNVYFLLGRCFEKIRHISDAEKWYLMAIRKGNPQAINNLAVLYENEFKNYGKAEEYFLKAIKKGNEYAVYNLAFLYQHEFKDYKKAEEFYLKAIEKGDVDAMFNLAFLYENELQDFRKAEKIYLKMIENEYYWAINNLAVLYENEFKDYKKAEEFYLKAIEKGDVDAIFNLASFYYTKYKDYNRAEKYCLKGVEKSDIDSMNGLAYLYYQTNKNKEKAYELASNAYKMSKTKNHRHTFAIILMWNNQIKKSLEIASKFLYDIYFLDRNKEDTTNYFLLLLAKKQYTFLHNYFTNEKAKQLQLKDRFKPIYYALMYYMQDQYPTEYLKMGSELIQTVEEIIAKVEQMAIDYQ